MPDNESKISHHSPSEIYRRWHPECFSDSKVHYNIPLTEEIFDVRFDYLSTHKLQAEFEKFVVSASRRLLTPNIKTQTGPDGGGDGKVDAETYEVSRGISDKWYIAEDEGAKGTEKWAFAISCKKQWKSKIESDVKKIVETDREYSRILFFTSQYVKSSTRAEVEQRLSSQYSIRVEIFDRSWCKDATFKQGCADIALKELAFSDVHKQKIVIMGHRDLYRKMRLEDLEKKLNRQVDGLDTGYVEELLECCVLSRELERPRSETEGRFQRARRECARHGLPQQIFNIVYDHAWTSYFWFDDPSLTVLDCRELERYVREDCTVARLEKYTNIVTVLTQAVRFGLVGEEDVKPFIEYLNELVISLAKDSNRKSCALFLRIQLATQRLIQNALNVEAVDACLDELRPLLMEAPRHLEISFESLYQVMQMLSDTLGQNRKFDTLLNGMAKNLGEYRSKAEVGKLHLDRGLRLLDKNQFQDAVKQLSFCCYAFDREEDRSDSIQSVAMMGFALWQMRLPYSAEGFLIQAVFYLLQQVRADGHIPHRLLTILLTLCEIELMIGRLSMYWNWLQLLWTVSRNGDFAQDPLFLERIRMFDAAWTCRLAAADLSIPIYAALPDIFDRLGMVCSSEFLKYELGYKDELSDVAREITEERDWRESLTQQPVFKQFLCDINVADVGSSRLQTTVNDFTFAVTYENTRDFQLIAQTLLASMESLLATADMNVLPICPIITVELCSTHETSSVVPNGEFGNYCFMINTQTFTQSIFWECIVSFVGFVFCYNSISKPLSGQLNLDRLMVEKLLDRVAILQRTKMAIADILGPNFRFFLRDWAADTDRIYPNRRCAHGVFRCQYENEVQHKSVLRLLNRDAHIWSRAKWVACAFVVGNWQPPILGLVFSDKESGEKIVQEWKAESGDGESSIKIYVIRGINAAHPTWYRVVIIPSKLSDSFAVGKRVSIMCQRNTMQPKTLQFLDAFISAYEKYRECWLMPFTKNCCLEESVRDDYHKGFRFSEVFIRDAYTIGKGDEAVLGILDEDNPIIPPERAGDAPILEVLAMRQSGASLDDRVK